MSLIKELLETHNDTSFTSHEAKEVRAFAEGTLDYFDMSTGAQDKLFRLLQAEMPYGVQKARTGDPDVWMADYLERLGPDGFERFLRQNTKPSPGL
jgi:hypothetical protein